MIYSWVAGFPSKPVCFEFEPLPNQQDYCILLYIASERFPLNPIKAAVTDRGRSQRIPPSPSCFHHLPSKNKSSGAAFPWRREGLLRFHCGSGASGHNTALNLTPLMAGMNPSRRLQCCAKQTRLASIETVHQQEHGFPKSSTPDACTWT